MHNIISYFFSLSLFLNTTYVTVSLCIISLSCPPSLSLAVPLSLPSLLYYLHLSPSLSLPLSFLFTPSPAFHPSLDVPISLPSLLPSPSLFQNYWCFKSLSFPHCLYYTLSLSHFPLSFSSLFPLSLSPLSFISLFSISYSLYLISLSLSLFFLSLSFLSLSFPSLSFTTISQSLIISLSLLLPLPLALLCPP